MVYSLLDSRSSLHTLNVRSRLKSVLSVAEKRVSLPVVRLLMTTEFFAVNVVKATLSTWVPTGSESAL